jgi:Kef-type K+ transport system membrane component KefB
VLVLVRPWLARLDLKSPDALRSPEGLSVTMAGLMLCAWFTDIIQIYAVFGAFILGAAMPRSPGAKGAESVADHLIRVVRPLSAAVVLPFFFTYSGLNTQLGLVNTPALWLLALGIIVIATLGKGVACYLAARATGQGHTEAASVGALMNARGLMELIILNIGLQRGIIEPTLFTLMVLMAIATTLAATPAFDWIQRRARSGVQPAG